MSGCCVEYTTINLITTKQASKKTAGSIFCTIHSTVTGIRLFDLFNKLYQFTNKIIAT